MSDYLSLCKVKIDFKLGARNPGSHFKIGKTSNYEERMRQNDYVHYTQKKCIFRSEYKELIDHLEIDLINHYKNESRYSDYCDNEQVGGGEMQDSEEYYIYLVIE